MLTVSFACFLLCQLGFAYTFICLITRLSSDCLVYYDLNIELIVGSQDFFHNLFFHIFQ